MRRTCTLVTVQRTRMSRNARVEIFQIEIFEKKNRGDVQDAFWVARLWLSLWVWAWVAFGVCVRRLWFGFLLVGSDS